MRPGPFVELLKQAITTAQHPGVVLVQTCAEVGRWEQPIGVRITLTDGWALIVQVVRASPAGGDTPSGDQLSGPWSDHPDYQEARAAADVEAAKVAKVRSGRPRASVTQVLTLARDALTAAGSDAIETVGVRARDGANPVLVATGVDGSTLFGLPAGWLAPGSTEFMNPAHQIPGDWY